MNRIAMALFTAFFLFGAHPAVAVPVADVVPRVQYTATSGQTVFDFPFRVFNAGDLVVRRTRAGVTTTLTLTTEYTIADLGEEDGGTVTLVSGADEDDIITIVRNVAMERATDYTTAGDFRASTLNREQNLQQMQIQELARDLELAVRFDPEIPGTLTALTTLPADRVGNFVGFDGLGNPTLMPAQDLDLTGVGVFSADQFQSVVATGTAPLIVASTTLVANLNADLLDGQSGAYYLDATNLTGTIADARLSANVPLLDASNTWSGALNTFSNAIDANGIDLLTGSFDVGGVATINASRHGLFAAVDSDAFRSAIANTTAQAAVDSWSSPDRGAVVIESSYAGADISTWNSRVGVLDLRASDNSLHPGLAAFTKRGVFSDQTGRVRKVIEAIKVPAWSTSEMDDNTDVYSAHTIHLGESSKIPVGIKGAIHGYEATVRSLQDGTDIAEPEALSGYSASVETSGGAPVSVFNATMLVNTVATNWGRFLYGNINRTIAGGVVDYIFAGVNGSVEVDNVLRTVKGGSAAFTNGINMPNGTVSTRAIIMPNAVGLFAYSSGGTALRGLQLDSSSNWVLGGTGAITAVRGGSGERVHIQASAGGERFIFDTSTAAPKFRFYANNDTAGFFRWDGSASGPQIIGADSSRLFIRKNDGTSGGDIVLDAANARASIAGNNGLTKTYSMRNPDGIATCTIIVTGGIATGGTC